MAIPLGVGIGLAGQEAAAEAPGPVRIVYSSGMPVEAMQQQGVDPDTYTCPTPRDSSVAVVAGQVADALRERGITVELVPVSEVKTGEELLGAPALVLAGSCHFGRADWGLKRLVDVQIGGLIRSGKAGHLAEGRIYAIGHSEGGPVFSKAPVALVETALAEAGTGLAGSFLTLDYVQWNDARRREEAARIAEEIAGALNGDGQP